MIHNILMLLTYKKQECGLNIENWSYSEETECVGFARLGSEDQIIVAGTMRQLQMTDFGQPLHCFVIAGKTHPVEEEMLDFYRLETGIVAKR
ncbi:Diphthine synthase-like protein [Quillaja saponaria]|uniref:Diphthine synthase-like protein n=1 Tax=Quillaja saponaria TaxID=32244 RepID=A0AAD7L1L4_QUISA|nr:Diphthine synthase-like protein [Quillaja saponaria]